MPRRPSRPLTYLLALTLATSLAVAQAFSDLETGEQRDAILALAARGVVRAYPDGRFRPEEWASRAALFAVVAVLAGLEEVPGEACFADVDPRAWYAPSLCAAARAGLVRGFEDGRVRPAEAVSYAEVIASLVRAREGPSEARAEVTPWYALYLTRAEALGLIAEHRYLPEQRLSRGALAELAYRVLELKEGSPGPVRRSSGCGRPPPETPPSSVLVEGRSRELIAYVPEGYHPDTTLALVVAFHGRSNANDQVRRYYGLEAPARGEAIIVYPSGLRQADGLFSWSDPGDLADALRDYTLFDHVLEAMSDHYCLDLDRVYLVGHSLGGWFAASLACARAAEVRAVAVIAGSVSPSPCGAPVAALVMHNPLDHLVAFEAGLRVRDLFIELNHCEEPPVPTKPRGLGCQRYPGCLGGDAVVWCPYEESLDYRGGYYPHVWPEGAGWAIWDFFRSLD